MMSLSNNGNKNNVKTDKARKRFLFHAAAVFDGSSGGVVFIQERKQEWPV